MKLVAGGEPTRLQKGLIRNHEIQKSHHGQQVKERETRRDGGGQEPRWPIARMVENQAFIPKEAKKSFHFLLPYGDLIKA